jgi:peptidoglycan/xylan/chitin deacetylase (PgdA/CDA1 family)
MYQRIWWSLGLAFALMALVSSMIYGMSSNPYRAATSPRGIVSLTFDDGYESVYFHALPILSKYNYRGVSYVPTGLIEEAGYMTWQQVRELQNTHRWEIGSHSQNHLELPTIPESEMIDEVVGSKRILAEHGITATNFATPFGAYDSATVREIAKIYQTHRGFWDREQLNTRPFDRYTLQVQSVERDTQLEDVQQWIDAAHINNEWLVLVLHDIAPNPNSDEQYVTTPDFLDSVANYISQTPVEVMTVREALALNSVNLFPNGQFTLGISQGWMTDQPDFVQSDRSGRGSYPDARSSIKFTRSQSDTHLFSPQIRVTKNQSYALTAFVNTEDLTSGEFGFYIDEYNEKGDWISGLWQGQADLDRVKEYGFIYRTSSAKVKKIVWQFYLIADSVGDVQLDSVVMAPILTE